MIDSKLMNKAKEVGNVEELIALSKKHGISLTQDEAEKYYSYLTKKGEMHDDELDSVSGGACHTTVDGKKYTVVTSALKCFTGMYEHKEKSYFEIPALRQWYIYSSDGCCGRCAHLKLKDGGLGYCSIK